MYDDIGNLLFSAFNTATNTYTANNLNQYTSVLCASAPLREISHDTDGNKLSDGVLSFTYDAANRLKTVSTNGVLVLTNFYDAKSRRIRKVTAAATTTFFYDGWNLIEERIVCTNGTTATIRYFWGKEMSELSGADAARFASGAPRRKYGKKRRVATEWRRKRRSQTEDENLLLRGRGRPLSQYRDCSYMTPLAAE